MSQETIVKTGHVQKKSPKSLLLGHAWQVRRRRFPSTDWLAGSVLTLCVVCGADVCVVLRSTETMARPVEGESALL
jgi:hypothetical protein